MNYRSFCEKLLLLSLIFVSTHSLKGIHYLEIGKQGFSLFAKSMYWYILSFQLYGAYQDITAKEVQDIPTDEELQFNNAPILSKKQDEFVRKTLKDHNFPASLYETVQIVPALEWGAKYHILYIPSSFDPHDADEERINYAKACIIHEGGHMQNHDRHRRLFIAAITPFIIHRISRPLLTKLIHPDSFVHSLLLIPSAFVNICSAAFIELLYTRYREAKADDEIVKRVTDPNILQAMSNFIVYGYKSSENVKTLSSAVSWKDRFKWATKDPSHPFILDRAKKFDNALQVLEAKQVNK